MSDLTDRLRCFDRQTCTEAAERIETLEAELAAMRAGGGPVAEMVPCHTPSGKRVAVISRFQHLPIGTKLYTHPQPARAVLAKFGTPPAMAGQLADEQIEDLLECGNPTDDEKRLVRMGWDAARNAPPAQTQAVALPLTPIKLRKSQTQPASKEVPMTEQTPTDTQQYLNVASQCAATATSELAKNVLVDDGSGTLRELLNDAADAIRAGWGSPVVAGVPVGEDGSMPGTQGFTTACFHSDKVLLGTKLYTAPQPTQAQAGAVPLTAYQIHEAIKAFKDSENLMGVNHIHVARAIERAHGIGIKGGQHDL